MMDGGKQKISLQLVQNMATKGYIPRAKKSSVKWKCEKEIVHLVHNYSVTGREPRKNVLKINLLLLWTIFLFFQMCLPFSRYIFTSDLMSSTQHQKWCFDIQNITGKTCKYRTRLFTLSKQTFPSHVSEATYYLRFCWRKYRYSKKQFFQAVLRWIEENSKHCCL